MGIFLLFAKKVEAGLRNLLLIIQIIINSFIGAVLPFICFSKLIYTIYWVLICVNLILFLFRTFVQKVAYNDGNDNNQSGHYGNDVEDYGDYGDQSGTGNIPDYGYAGLRCARVPETDLKLAKSAKWRER